MQLLLFGLLQHLILMQAITVEHNMFAYYKIPLDLLFTAARVINDSEPHYFVLQCPRNTSADIPKPADMQSCNVISKYKESMWQRKLPQPTKVVSKLHTKVNYRLKHPPTTKHPLPYRIVLGTMPINVGRNRHKRPQQQSHTLRIIHDQRISDSKKQKTVTAAPAGKVSHYDAENYVDTSSEEKDFIDDDDISNEPNTHSSLKYLGVKDAIGALIRQKAKGHIGREGDNRSMQLSADNMQYKKGSRIKGYQQLIHRDETFKDHIFYDELKEDGKYVNYGKAHTTFK